MVKKSSEAADEGLHLPETRASELNRLSKGLEPNRRTVWPSDARGLPRRIYIDGDSRLHCNLSCDIVILRDDQSKKEGSFPGKAGTKKQHGISAGDSNRRKTGKEGKDVFWSDSHRAMGLEL